MCIDFPKAQYVSALGPCWIDGGICLNATLDRPQTAAQRFKRSEFNSLLPILISPESVTKGVVLVVGMT